MTHRTVIASRSQNGVAIRAPMSLRGRKPVAIRKKRILRHCASQNDRKQSIPNNAMNYYIYILANKTNVAIYTGVTNDLARRIYEHKNDLNPASFCSRYS